MGRPAAQLFLLALSVSAPREASAQERCHGAIDAATTQRLFAALVALRAQDACRLAGVSTESARMELRWTRDGAAVEPLTLVPSECAAVPSREGGLSVLRPSAFLESCPATAAALRELLARPPPALSFDAPPTSWGPGVQATRGLALVAALFALLLVLRSLGLALPGSRATRAGPAPRDKALLAWSLAGFALALAVRLRAVPTLSNWYVELLPPSGPGGEARFGPGAFVYQALLRAALPFDDLTLPRANAVLGALAVPLFAGVLRERAVEPVARLVACGLLALSPLHALVSASPAEHVLASTLSLVVLLAWARGYPRGDLRWLGLGASCAAFAATTRPDAWLLLGVLPLWGFLPERSALRPPDAPRKRRVLWALAYYLAWGLTGLAVRTIAARSHHPVPQLREVAQSARMFVAQYVDVGFAPPRWMSPAPVLLAAVGVLAMLRARATTLACVLLTLLASFVPLGRNLAAGGIVGARYFLLTLPLFFLLSGEGVAGLASAAHRLLRVRKGSPWLRASAASLALLVTVLQTRAVWRHRYTFQDEYAFLRRELARLPAGCEVVQLQVRSPRFDRDLDCCLDAPRSPLRLAYPSLRFGLFSPEQGANLGDASCVAYYESAACSLASTPGVLAVHGRAAELLGRQCRAARAAPRELLAEQEVSVSVVDECFEGRRPRVGLYRLR